MVMPADIAGGKIDERRVARISDAHIERLSRYKLEKGDIVYGRRGDIGRQALIRDAQAGWLCGTGCLRVRLGDAEVSPEFLHRYLKMPEIIGWIQGQAIGATMPNLNTDILNRVPVYFPRRRSQNKIAAILTAYDDLIETNKRHIALLEKMAEEIYREWFVRMRFPGYHNTRLVRGVPENWDHKQFGRFCMLKRGYDLPNALVEDGPYPVVASTSIKTFHKHYKVEPPVITTGRSGSLGDVLMTQSRAWPLNTSLYVRDFFGNSPYLVFYTLKSMGLEKFNSGAGVPTLNRNHLNGIPIAVPDKSLQQRFEEFVEPVHQQAECFRVANHTLAETRDLLLPRLISGMLSVEDLDIQFPPSMKDAA